MKLHEKLAAEYHARWEAVETFKAQELASPPISPAKRLPRSKPPTHTSTRCDFIATPMKPIANCA